MYNISETHNQNKHYINPFSTNVSVPYSLKTSENLRFSDIFRGYRSRKLVENWLAENIPLSVESPRYSPGLLNPRLHKSETYMKKCCKKPVLALNVLQILQKHFSFLRFIFTYACLQIFQRA